MSAMFTSSFCTTASALALLLLFSCAVPTPVSARKQGGSWGPKKCAKAAAKAARKGCSAEASATTPGWMFVQTASSCRLRGKRNQLELTTPAATTLAFTDRPVRNATVLDTSEFDDSFVNIFDPMFEGNPPNAVLTASRGDGTVVRIVLIVESPDADGVAGQLTYGVSQSATQAATGSIASVAGDDLSDCSLFIE